MGKFIFNKYYKECQSELKRDDVTKNGKLRLKKHDVFYHKVYVQHAFKLGSVV